MSIRVDSSPLIANSLIVGDSGHGVLAEEVPSSGDSGAGYIYNDLSLPADNGKEVRGEITTWPSSGTLTAYEDSSFTFSAPDGSYYFEYQLYVDGVATGSPARVDLVVGSLVVSGTTAGINVETYAGTVTTDINIAGSLASIDVSANQGAVSTGTNISGTTAEVGVSAFAGSVTTDINVIGITAGINVTTYQSTVNSQTSVNGTTASIDITPFLAAVTEGNQTIVGGTTASIEATGYQGTVYNSVVIDATAAAIGVIGYRASVSTPGNYVGAMTGTVLVSSALNGSASIQAQLTGTIEVD